MECGQDILGRKDKRYCSDYCRAQYFNTLHAQSSRDIRRINYTIRKNRNILCKLNPDGKIRVHKMKLIELGLNFDYFTNIYKTKAGKTYFFCYDQGYIELEDEYYALVVKQDYVG